jgi:DNA-binding NarL/FixJ family response regulator
MPVETKPMRLLLIEDDVGEALRLTECANCRTDVRFIGITDSCEEGIKLVKSRLPEGVILDLQLVAGKGTGLRFMELLNEAAEELTVYPIVVVTSSNQSKKVFRRIEELGADWFFCKTAEGYDVNVVLDTLLSLRPALHTATSKPVSQGDVRSVIETPDERRNRIYKRVDIELDLIGVRAKLKGRSYLREAIYVQIHSDKERGSGIEEVAIMEKKQYGSIAKAMQKAIEDTWDRADMEDIYTHFTARITSKNGVPFVSDFIHFYADKIKNSID